MGDSYGVGRKRCTKSGPIAAFDPLQWAKQPIMPFARASFRALGPSLRRLVRIAGVAIVAGVSVFALALLAVRFIVFPRIETYRDTLTATLSAQLGQPVEIASLATGGAGWDPNSARGGAP